LKALEPKTKQYIASLGDASSPRLPPLLRPANTSFSLVEERPAESSPLEETPRKEFQHSTNSFVDQEMRRRQSNQARFGRYQRTYNVEDVVSENWSSFSDRHLAAIERATAGGGTCVPTIYVPHGRENGQEEGSVLSGWLGHGSKDEGVDVVEENPSKVSGSRSVAEDGGEGEATGGRTRMTGTKSSARSSRRQLQRRALVFSRVWC
jgi:hypothetical protein